MAIRPDGLYIDGTFGRGGHARAVLAQLGPEGRLLALDRDPEALACGRVLADSDPRFAMVHSAYSALGGVLEARGLGGRVDGILLDVGVSSPQLEDPVRGFSFRHSGPLDMRMDPASGPSAADWLNTAPEADIARVLWRFGEERSARRIARAIAEQRASTPFVTTTQLAVLIESVVRGEPGRHPATRSFQAIRMHINQELEELAAVLVAARSALAVGGRLCVISFHSLEDRMVKRFLRDNSRVDPALRSLPRVPDAALPTLLLLTTKAVRPGAAEVSLNPRARSAVLRAAEKQR